MTTESDVQDYGTSDFKGRPLDTAFARVTIRLRNPILGEYKDACFVFGRIADPEFNMTREPIVAACDDEDAIKLWQSGHKFQSHGSLAVDWEFGAAVTGRRVFIFGHGDLAAKRFGLSITDDR